jgi:hypothetical protein
MRDGGRILEALLNQPDALGGSVPSGRPHDRRTRTVHCLLGSFNLTRTCYQTANGNDCPLDRAPGLIDSYSPGLAESMCRAAGMDGSCDEAQQTLKLYAGVCVPASQIRRIVRQVGSDLHAWSRSREEARCEKAPTMYVSYDGTGVPMRKEETDGLKGKQADGTSLSREVKLGCVFTGTRTDEEGRAHCGIRDQPPMLHLSSPPKCSLTPCFKKPG